MMKEYDFVIVGAGAGGGPLAANLALEGFSVVVIEAGGDDINDNYSVPAFHPLATEDPAFSWDFFVRHYSENPERDNKHHPNSAFEGATGIFYPRASGVGGCTLHHAMITVYPHESDWNKLAEAVHDESWRAENMRKYFDRIERVEHRDQSALLRLLQPGRLVGDFLRRFRNGTGDGARGEGWLPLTQANPLLLLKDVRGVSKIVKQAFSTAIKHKLRPMPGLDPNHPSVARNNAEGINVIPISVGGGRRSGARDRIIQAQQTLRDQTSGGQKGGRLDIQTHTFATKVLFDGTRAIGVECVEGRHLYGARHHTLSQGTVTDSVQYMASKEVILCGGAFNTPQLLMLSGLGPAKHLKEMGIEVRANLPGVGANLQDRYEVGVVARAAKPFDLLEHATFRGRDNPADPDPDKHYSDWREDGEGIYATNGAVLGVIKRSSTQGDADPPDLYIFGIPGQFCGYEKGYSTGIGDIKDHFTWAVLKGHTDNVSGYVRLRTPDPLDTPEIHFKYFEESKELHKKDLQSVVDGVKFALEICDELLERGVLVEIVAPKDRSDLHEFVRDAAWGHHASCTCKIGPASDNMAVLDANFQVRGIHDLRVVDASVFPRIPGLFLVSSVYMISEKASDAIIEKARKATA